MTHTALPARSMPSLGALSVRHWINADHESFHDL
jgi:hypothetical protein